MQDRRVGHARQAAIQQHPAGSDDEEDEATHPKQAAYSALGAQRPTYDLAHDWQVVDTNDPAYVAASHQQYLQATRTNASRASKQAADTAYS
jgi:hypothetical protein